MKTVVRQNIARARGAGIPLALKSFTTLAFDGIKVTTRHESPGATERMTARTILVVSEDAAWGEGLCLIAAKSAIAVVQALYLCEAIEQASRVQPAAILLDLDLSSAAGWQAAEWFLGHGPNVPILLLTGRADHHELGAAIRSGVVLEKSTGSAQLLRVARSMLEVSAQQSQERIALQQAWLRRVKPYRWEAAAAPGYRHWGINE